MKKHKPTSGPSLSDGLNDLLAAYQVAYFNARAAHWMIKGENFFELHKVFETVYNDATEKIDAIAERILTMGEKPLLSAKEMVARSIIKERATDGDESACIKNLLEDLTQLSNIEKELVKLADEADDVVTADLLTGYMGEQQKTAWMLSQFLSRRSKVV
jgi:starvation-inducible DNA-binding protein